MGYSTVARCADCSGRLEVKYIGVYVGMCREGADGPHMLYHADLGQCVDCATFQVFGMREPFRRRIRGGFRQEEYEPYFEVPQRAVEQDTSIPVDWEEQTDNEEITASQIAVARLRYNRGRIVHTPSSPKFSDKS